MTAFLEVEHLSAHFDLGRVSPFGSRRFLHAVSDVTFNIQTRETFGLVGESGCGKSTTAKLILGIHEPSSGTVRVNGKDLAALDRRGWREQRKKIQYVFQDPLGSLDPRMTAINQVIEPLTIHRIGKPDERHKKALTLLEQVGFHSEQHDRYPHQLSGGERQRVAIARALVNEPDCVLLDEPTGNLDEHTGEGVRDLIESLRDQLGIAFVMVTHDMKMARSLGRVLRLEQGRLVQEA